MKLTTFIAIAGSVTATAFAGGSKEVIAPTPPPSPTLGGWFIGGTYGQFEADGDLGSSVLSKAAAAIDPFDVDKFDFDMYTLHVGRDLGTQVAGFDVAAYLEVGFLDGSATISYRDASAGNIDVEIVPITANLKLERALFGPVNFYLTGGLGYAFTDVSANGDSDNDGGFYAQASAGLLYNVNSQFELFAGGRWLYLNTLQFGAAPLDLDDAFAWEIGARVNF
ncbi:MAG: hypothetical protein KGQ89_10120 [Verrucomicrobia bacterium]|nr:hypothetical protein [Verrucomicrobiota bacterium]